MLRNVIVITSFFISGFAGLVYEVCWIRKASVVFGSTTYALSTVLAVFFGGLALGSYVFGRIGQRTHQPIRLYALLEISLGILAVLTIFEFELADIIYGSIYRGSADHPAVMFTARFLLVSAALLPPAILMGGTLPLFCRQFVVSKSRIALSIGLLYGVNTFGAALGCALTGVFLIPTIGVNHSIQLGAALSAWAGISAGSLRMTAKRISATDMVSPTGDGRYTATVAALFFLSGFVALANEIVWTRYLSLLVHNKVYTYTVTLTVVLVGIVLGSVVTSRYFDRLPQRAWWFGAIQVVSGIFVLNLLLLPPELWRWVSGGWQRLVGEEFLLYCLLLLPPAILSGAAFPRAVRMVVESPTLSSIGVGRMAAVNTLGGIVGSLMIGFWALPSLGLQSSLMLTTGISLVTGFACWLVLDRSSSLFERGVLIACASLFWLVSPLILNTRIPEDYLAPPTVS